MARTNNLTNFLTDVSSAIKQKTGDNTPIPASDFDTEILSIETGGSYQSKTLEVRQNGNYNLLPDTGYDAISDVSISVSVSPILQNKTITENGSYTADQNYDGLGTVIVNVQGSTINNQDKTITQNGTYTADSGYTGLGEVTVNVPSGSGDVKLFDTVEHMQADPDASEGDLAVVYREELTGVTEESEFDSCTFPDEVILDEAFSGNINGSFRAVDRSVMFDGMVDMSSSRFRFNGWGESSEIRVQYTSQDGITYTRTDGGEELQEFGVTIKWESWGDPFNSIIGNFMKIGGNYFEGLYNYGYNAYPNIMQSISINNLNPSIYFYIPDNFIISNSSLWRVILVVKSYHYDNIKNCNIIDVCDAIFCDSTENEVGLTLGNIWNLADISFHIGNDFFSKPTGTYKVHTYNFINNTETITDRLIGRDLGKTSSSNSINCSVYEFSENDYYIPVMSSQKFSYSIVKTIENPSSTTIASNIQSINIEYLHRNDYALTKTNLDVSSDYVYEKTFYGKNGVENGTLTTSVSNSFTDVSSAVYAKIQAQYDNMQPRVLTDQDKTIDKNIRIIPSRSDGTPLLDTSNVTNMYVMFSGCSNLTSIPLLNTSNVTDMRSMFDNCTSLTTISLLNTSNVTDMRSMFSGCSNLTSIPLLDTSKVTDMHSMFYDCSSLTIIPLLDTKKVNTMNSMFADCSSLTIIPLLNTSNVTDMGGMFAYCKSLTSIPLLNTSNVTNMHSMFTYCESLNNESLNNILAMCTNAAKITSNKTLKYIGLTEEQANICKTLSNYSAFIAAGWTTGY